MTSPMYTYAVPVFKQMLMALKAILAQASAHAAAQSIEPDALLQARLYPDMFALAKQVQIAADFARGVSARLAGVEVPTHEGQEKSFADLDTLLAQTVSFLEGLSTSQFEGSESKEIILRPGTPKEKRLVGQTYLANYGLPQFFFHVTTAYAILRHNGIAIGKRDYMGELGFGRAAYGEPRRSPGRWDCPRSTRFSSPGCPGDEVTAPITSFGRLSDAGFWDRLMYISATGSPKVRKMAYR